MADPRSSTWRRGLSAVTVGLAVAALARWARRHPRRVRDLVRSFNKHALNPAVLRFAGRARFYAAVLHHSGRRSGRAYATPVVAEPVEDGFVIPLPYGADTDWCRNLLAAGRAAIRHRGETVVVTHPRVVDAAAALSRLPPRRRARWWLRPRRFLLVRRTAEAVTSTDGAEPASGEARI